MKIAILSGKGGTGKTLLAVNLASIANESIYIDCDVEEPNGYLFFKPVDIIQEDVVVKIPVIDNSLCNGCRKCVDFCKYNALAYVGNKVMLFDNICHSCGGCSIVCPNKCISETNKVIGITQKGKSEHVIVNTGMLNVGEVSGIPIINNLINQYKLNEDKTIIIDCPPGSSCTVMDSIKDVDYCVLVAEPTLFGVHNLNIVYELVKLFNKPCAVVINKCLDDNNPVEDFCINNNINIIGKIPFDHNISTLNSNGNILVRTNWQYKSIFNNILTNIIKEVQDETIVSS